MYEQHKQEPFNLSEKLAEYCMSDNEILMHGMIKMRDVFLEITRKDRSNDEEMDVKEKLEQHILEQRKQAAMMSKRIQGKI